jgi:phosphate transport system substrate-binding protein
MNSFAKDAMLEKSGGSIQNRSTMRHMSNLYLSALLIVFLSAGSAATYAENVERLSQIKKLYVGSLGTDNGAAEMREQMVRQLRKSHEVELVSDPKAADAVVKGTGRIWVTGRVSLNPRSHSSSQPVYEGFLSVEVAGESGEVFWSYLVTPSKFPWNGIEEDLANQLVTRLLRAIKEEGSQATAVPSLEVKSTGTLRGAGATFPSPLYQQWFELFQEEHPDVQIHYDAVGSAEGIRQLEEHKVDFAASEMPLSDAAMAEAHQRFVHVPSVLGAVVPIYNVKGLHQTLNFTPEILSRIFLGNIKKWNDPQIKMSNRDADLPDAEIVVIHRSDGSGTSFVWTDYLSKVSPQWKTSVGNNASVQWPVGVGAEGSEGVAYAVQQTANSMGYVEFIYAIQHELSFGAVRNSSGQYIHANISSVTAAAATAARPGQDLRISITDPPGRNAYPIATYTWLLLPDPMQNKNTGSALMDLIRWMLVAGQKKCSALGYAPLPVDIAKRALESIEAK